VSAEKPGRRPPAEAMWRAFEFLVLGVVVARYRLMPDFPTEWILLWMALIATVEIRTALKDERRS